MSLTTENITKLIEERKSTYRIENNAVPAFNQEQELSKEYNGRQVLELIQNADDANAKLISITLNTEKSELSIFNNGEPFNYNGIRSILIANYSSKVSSNYIGNKGLGFRSLIVWADVIQIVSAGFTFSFSHDIALKQAKDLGLDIGRINQERHLSIDCCPFPILGIPEFEKVDSDDATDHGCTISLKYKKEYENDIISQLEQIDEKTLLFLKHIQHIEIQYEKSQSRSKRSLKIEKIDENNSIADGIEWYIINKAKALPQEYQDPNKSERKSYEIKIAIPLQSEQNYRLYNYLPTSEELALPYIIHATLDLSSSRKHINENNVNKYILETVAECISGYVDSMLESSDQCNWDAYEMMTPKILSSSAIVNDSLYKKLIELRDKKRIFPTVGLNYVSKEEYYFFSEKDSNFWSNYSVKKGIVKKILFKIPDFLMSNSIENRKIPSEEYISSLKDILETELDISDRAKLICYLVCSGQIEGDSKLDSVFVNDSNQIIKGDDTHNVFTPKPKGVEYKLPQFINIEFINRNLYDLVLGELKKTNIYQTTIDAYKDSKDTRAFSSILSKITRISDYDKNDIIRVIISQSNTLLKSNGGDKVSIIKEMVSCLFEIFKNSTDFATFDSVPLLNQNSEVAKASKLLFPTPDNKYVFGDDNKDYLLDKKEWGIDFGEDDEIYWKFMRSLGANQMTKYAIIPNSSGLLAEYANYLFLIHEFEENRIIYNVGNMIKSMCDESLIQFSDLLLNKVHDLNLQQIFYLLATNAELFELVSKTSETLKFQYIRSHYKETNVTFLRFQFLRLESVKMKVLSNEVILEELDKAKIEKIDPVTKNTVLSFLTSNLRGVEIDKIASILNQLKTIEYSQKGIRKVYKILIDTLSLDKRSLKDKDIELCAYTENGIGFFPVKEVYYSDNTSLPKELLSAIGKHRLYYTTRQGANKVCDAFGIEPLDNYHPKLLSDTVLTHDLNDEFSHLYKEMKLYVLLYSMQNLDSDQKKIELANRLKKSQITLVKNAKYEMTDSNVPLDLHPKEFIQEEGNYSFYLNSDDAISLNDLQNSVDYCNAITEILSIITKLEGKDNTFIRIFQNLDFMKQSANQEFTVDERSEAKSLLGISPEEAEFWGLVLKRDISDMPEEAIYKAALELIKKEAFSFNKVDFKTWLTKESKQLLENLKDVVPNVLDFVDLSVLNSMEFGDIKRNCKNKYVHSLWECLSERKEEQEKYIEYQQKYDDMTFSGNHHRLYSSDDYVRLLIETVKEKINLPSCFTWYEEETLHHCQYKEHESALKELSIEKQSLFYFEGNDALINSYIQDLNEANDEIDQNISSSPDRDIEESELKIVNINNLSKRNPHTKTKQRPSGIQRNYSTNSDKLKRETGEEAESLVKKLLDKEGYESHWRSSYSDEADKDDTLGYDFEYKKKEDSEWRFLEVKSFNNHSFIVSRHEYEVSQDLDHKGKYDIALVKDGNVYIIENFFEDHSHYSQVPENYSIYCDLPNEFL